MRKAEIDSILLVNWYFTTCKLKKPLCPKNETVRKYLLKKVNNALAKDTPRESNLVSRVFIIIALLFLTNF